MKKMILPIILLVSSLSAQAIDPLKGPSRSAGDIAKDVTREIGEEISSLDRDIQAPFDTALASGKSFGQVVDGSLQPIQSGITEQLEKINYQKGDPQKIHQELTSKIREFKRLIGNTNTDISNYKENIRNQLIQAKIFIDQNLENAIKTLYQKYSVGKDYFSKKEALYRLHLYNDYYKEMIEKKRTAYKDLISDLEKQVQYLNGIKEKIHKSSVERKEHRRAADILQAYAEMLKTSAEMLESK